MRHDAGCPVRGSMQSRAQTIMHWHGYLESVGGRGAPFCSTVMSFLHGFALSARPGPLAPPCPRCALFTSPHTRAMSAMRASSGLLRAQLAARVGCSISSPDEIFVSWEARLRPSIANEISTHNSLWPCGTIPWVALKLRVQSIPHQV